MEYSRLTKLKLKYEKVENKRAKGTEEVEV